MEAGLDAISLGEVDRQLSRILATDGFRRSPSLGRFLKYLVDHALEGGQEGLKEYRLGLEVFDRGDSFDPRNDTIVRVQARNLRARLDEYFKDERPADTIRFVLPKGAYTLHFERIEITPPAVSDPPAPVEVRPVRHGRRWAAVAAALIAVIGGGAALMLFSARHVPPGSASAGPMVLVAPFANLSADPDNEYFASGLTEELIDALANLPGLRVAARASSPRWKDKDLDFANLRQLGVEHVVEGSVRKQGNKIRISVRLVDTRNQSHLWSHEYDREIQDSILTEQEIATAIAATLKLRLTPGAETSSARSANPDAYDLYLKGRYGWHQYDAASALRGIAYLERSLSLDPSFAPAYVALAGCYGTQVIYYRMPPVEGYAKVREMALKALQLDDTLAEAHTFLGGTYAWNDWNWRRAELEFRGAVQLAPQSVIAHQYYGSFLGALGRQSEAEEQIREAIRLDPLDTIGQWAEAQLMHWRGEDKAAEAVLNRIVKQDPGFGLTGKLLAEVEWALGKDGDALAVLRDNLTKHPSDSILLGELGYSLAKSGHVKEAGDVLNQLDMQAHGALVPGQARAFVYLGLGDSDKAISELWKSADERSLRVPWLKVDPIYEPLRKNPRWSELLRHVGLL